MKDKAIASIYKNNNSSPLFETVLEKRLKRRELLGGMSVVGAATSLPGCSSVSSPSSSSSLTFTELPHALDGDLTVPPGYQYQVLIRWGDPVFEDSLPFDPHHQTQAAQLTQFGYNSDFIGFMLLPIDSNNSNNALLSVNHEYTVPKRMQPDTKGMCLSMPAKLLT